MWHKKNNVAHYKLCAGRTQNGLHSKRCHLIYMRCHFLHGLGYCWHNHLGNKEQVRFQVFSEDLGIRIRPDKTGGAKPRDFKLLAHIREELKCEWEGKSVPTKVIHGVSYISIIGIRVALNRLWRAGEIEKFCTSLHTQSHGPNYVMWYIWSDSQTVVNPEAPHFFMDKRHYPK